MESLWLYTYSQIQNLNKSGLRLCILFGSDFISKGDI